MNEQNPPDQTGQPQKVGALIKECRAELKPIMTKEDMAALREKLLAALIAEGKKEYPGLRGMTDEEIYEMYPYDKFKKKL